MKAPAAETGCPAAALAGGTFDTYFRYAALSVCFSFFSRATSPPTCYRSHVAKRLPQTGYTACIVLFEGDGVLAFV